MDVVMIAVSGSFWKGYLFCITTEKIDSSNNIFLKQRFLTSRVYPSLCPKRLALSFI